MAISVPQIIFVELVPYLNQTTETCLPISMHIYLLRIAWIKILETVSATTNSPETTITLNKRWQKNTEPDDKNIKP